MKTAVVDAVSLDHDLGGDARGTGYDVYLWVEEHVALHDFMPPLLYVHSANTGARQRMQAAIVSIECLPAARNC